MRQHRQTIGEERLQTIELHKLIDAAPKDIARLDLIEKRIQTVEDLGTPFLRERVLQIERAGLIGLACLIGYSLWQAQPPQRKD